MEPILKKCRVTDDMGELGSRKDYIEYELDPRSLTEGAERYFEDNPPGPTVKQVWLQFTDGITSSLENKGFDKAAYKKAVADKCWSEEYFKRTGSQWQEGAEE